MDATPERRRGPWGTLFIVGAVILLLSLVAAAAGVYAGMRDVASASRQTFFSVQRAECDRFTPIETRSHTIWLRELDSGVDPDLAIASIRVTDVGAGVELPFARTFRSELNVNNIARVGVARASLVEGREYEICLDIAAPVTQIEIAPWSVGESAMLFMAIPCVAVPLCLLGAVLTCVGGVLWLVNR